MDWVGSDMKKMLTSGAMIDLCSSMSYLSSGEDDYRNLYVSMRIMIRIQPRDHGTLAHGFEYSSELAMIPLVNIGATAALGCKAENAKMVA